MLQVKPVVLLDLFERPHKENPPWLYLIKYPQLLTQGKSLRPIFSAVSPSACAFLPGHDIQIKPVRPRFGSGAAVSGGSPVMGIAVPVQGIL
jgi:hypothetical protein